MNVRAPGHTCALLVLACALASPCVGSAAGRPDAPSKALVQAADQLEAAAAERSRQPRALHSSASSLTAIGALPGSGHVSIDTWAQSELRRIASERSSAVQARELHDLAQALRRAASEETGSTPSTEPQALAASILAQRSYAHEETKPAPAPQETLLHKILRKLGILVQQLEQAVFGAAVAVPAFGRILVIMFMVVVAAAAVYLIYLLITIIVRRERRTRPATGTPLAPLIHPETLYEQAKTAARHGHYAQAVALLFQASLHVLDQFGKLPYDASLTPGEYRRAVRRSVAAAGDPFDQIAKTFVLAAFAQRSITLTDFAAADQAYRTLCPLLTA